MSKQYLKFGFAETIDVGDGIYRDSVIEKYFYVDISRNTKRYLTADQLNDDLTISNNFSVVMDPWVENNFFKLRYVYYKGTRWKVVDVEVNYPRLIFNLGGVYNGPEPDSN